MKISNYYYKVDELPVSGYMHQEYGSYIKEWAGSIKVLGNRVALLYAGGPVVHHSDIRNINELADKSNVAIKTQLGYNVFNVAKMLNIEFEYVSINGNTCASSMYCLHEANRLIAEGFTDVIIIAMDMKNKTQDLLFTQLGIDIKCSSGIALIHLTSGDTGIAVRKTTWKWNNDRSPMTVSKDGYRKVLEEFEGVFDWYKVHGSGTVVNTDCEYSLLDSSKIIEYKSIIGHTQGASTLVELCMLLEDDSVNGRILMLASGLGGFYGGAEVIKEK